jgi:cell division protein FtsQ
VALAAEDRPARRGTRLAARDVAGLQRRSRRPRLGSSDYRLAGGEGLLRMHRVSRALMVVLAAEVIWIVLASPRLAVRAVELRGDPQVVAQLAPRLEFPANMNLLRAPTRKLVRELDALPEVQNARVTRHFPGRLVATVERREAVAVIRSGEQAVLVDPHGALFAIRDEWGWGLPELFAPHLTGADLQGRAAKQEMARLLKVLQVLGPDPSLRVTRLELLADDEMTAVLESGAKVRLGSEEQLPAKIKLLRAALAQLGADRIDTLDLSDPPAAYWVRRERGGGVEVRTRWPG